MNQEIGKHDNILKFIIQKLENGELKSVHSDLRKINGIADKIACIILRDIALIENVTLPDDIAKRIYLQPIDIWIKRYCEIIGKKFSKPHWKKYAEFIVKESMEHNTSPEKVNMGVWYFASQIVGSHYKLEQILEKEHTSIQRLTADHVKVFCVICKSFKT